MKNIIRVLSVLVCAVAIANIASAASYYWVATDKSIDGFSINVRLIQTTTSNPPVATSLGRDVSVSSGPFSSKGEARSNCDKTAKLVSQTARGYAVRNSCTQTIMGR